MLEVRDTAPGHVGQPHPSTFNLVSAASTLQLACDLGDLCHPASGHWMAAGDKTTRRIDNLTTSERSCATAQQGQCLSSLAELKCLVVHQFGHGERGVYFCKVDIRWVKARQ